MTQNRLGLSPRIQELRKAKKIKQADLAEMIGISSGLLSRYERGSLVPSHDRLESIAAALGVEAEELGVESIAKERELTIEAKYEELKQYTKKLQAFIVKEHPEQEELLTLLADGLFVGL